MQYSKIVEVSSWVLIHTSTEYCSRWIVKKSWASSPDVSDTYSLYFQVTNHNLSYEALFMCSANNLSNSEIVETKFLSITANTDVSLQMFQPKTQPKTQRYVIVLLWQGVSRFPQPLSSAPGVLLQNQGLMSQMDEFVSLPRELSVDGSHNHMLSFISQKHLTQCKNL